MSRGGLFALIANDGKADRMLMATELINKSLQVIERMHNKKLKLPYLKLAVDLYPRFVTLKMCLYKMYTDMDDPMYMPRDMWKEIVQCLQNEIVHNLNTYDADYKLSEIESYAHELKDLKPQEVIDSEKTQQLFINATFKPFTAFAYEPPKTYSNKND